MRGLKSSSFAKVIGNTISEHGSSIQSCGRSTLASSTSISSGTQGSRTCYRRKISREERYAMVEDFVEKYKTANAGKFPSKRLTTKEVGGSFYTIRSIIQELQYKSRHSLLNQNARSDSGEPIQKGGNYQLKKQSPLSVNSKNVSNFEPLPSSSYWERFSDSEINILQVCKLNVDESISMKTVMPTTTVTLADSDRDDGGDQNERVTTGVTSNSGETVRSLEASDIEAVSTSSSVGTPSDHAQSSGGEDVQQEISAESKASTKLMEMHDRKMPQDHSADVPKSTDSSASPESAVNAELLPKKQTIWSNLKSVANGILQFWKKL